MVFLRKLSLGTIIPVTMNMYIPATAAVTMNIRIVSPRSLPTFLVFAILEIELEIEKKMSGTSRTNSRFNHICPIGNRNDALSPRIIHSTAPISTNTISMIGYLYAASALCLFSVICTSLHDLCENLLWKG